MEAIPEPLVNLLNLGVLGTIFVMLVLRIGLMTTKEHNEVTGLLKDAITEHKNRADRAEENAKVAVQAAEAATSALDALRQIASDRRNV